MWSDVEVYGRQRGIFVDHPAHGLVAQGFAGLIREEMPAGCDFYAEIASIFFENAQNGRVGNLYPAFLGAFSIDKDCSVIQVDIAGGKTAELRYAHARGK